MNSILLALKTAVQRSMAATARFRAVQWTNDGEPARRAMESAQETLRLARNAFEQALVAD